MASPYSRRRRKSTEGNKNNNKPLDMQQPTTIKAETAAPVYSTQDFSATARPNRNGAVRKSSVGTNAMNAIQKWTIALKPFELQFPNNMKTYHLMYTRDEAVGGVLNATYTLVGKAFYNGKVQYNRSSENSKAAAEFVQYLLDNLNEGTMHQFARDAASFVQYGFSVIEKDYIRKDLSDYDGLMPMGMNKNEVWGIDRLMPLPQRSLDPSEPFVFGNDGRDILALRQNTEWFTDSSHALRDWESPERTVTVRRNKFMLMGMNASSSNPFGVSPLEQVWQIWKEKEFYNNYLSVGVSKDMAGMPLMLVPSNVLDEASRDVNSDAYKTVSKMAADLAAMHSGEQNMAILPSDLQEGSNQTRQYDMKFLGIDGMGKQYSLLEIIQKKTEAIYAALGALNLISGTATGGSYNQWEGQNTIHTFTVQNIIRIIEDAINHDLIPQLLKMNGIKLSYQDRVWFKSSDIEPVSLEEISKTIQRITTSGLYPMVPEFINEVLEKTDFNYRIPTQYKSLPSENKWSYDDFRAILSGDTSRSGDGKGTSGTGGTQTVSGGDNNLENKG